MKKFQLLSIILLTILAINGCKKVEPQKTTTDTEAQVTAFVGSGGASGAYSDGVGKLSAFNFITGLALDAAGNLYVNDQNNFRIRKVTPAGVVSTFAGTGVNGYVDGPATTAQFSYLEGLAIDASGNLYAADYGNNVIRKITPAGAVSTYAGTGQRGYMDGPVATAQFSLPTSLAIDKAGNIYTGEIGNIVIRKISPAGIVSTYAGVLNTKSYYGVYYNGPATELILSEFMMPGGITADPSGNIYLLENYHNMVYKITPDGNAVTLAGTGARADASFTPYNDGLGITAQFNDPEAISSDALGNLYVADTKNQRIRKIAPNGEVTTLVGNGEKGSVNGKIADARLLSPHLLVSNPEGSIIYFAEKNIIRKLEFNKTKLQNSWNNPQSWGNPK